MTGPIQKKVSQIKIFYCQIVFYIFLKAKGKCRPLTKFVCFPTEYRTLKNVQI